MAIQTSADNQITVLSASWNNGSTAYTAFKLDVNNILTPPSSVLFDIGTNTGTYTSRFLINVSGSVGIGTNNPTARLHISGSATGTTPTLLVRHGVAEGSDLPVLSVQNSAGSSLFVVSGSGDVRSTGAEHRWTASSGNSILHTFYNSSATELGSVGYLFGGSDLSFTNKETFGNIILRTANTTQMIVRFDGNVGIGTTTAFSDRLLVKGSTSDSTATALRLENSSETFLTARNDGVVAIGTSVLGSKFSVLGSTSTSQATAVVRAGTAAQTSGVDIFDVQNSSGTSLFNVSGSGFVGIGTTNNLVGTKVAIYGATAPDTFTGHILLSSDTASSAINNGGQLNFQMYDGSSYRGSGFIKSAKENGTASNYASYMSFGTRVNGDSFLTERMRINSTGNIGIGDTNPQSFGGESHVLLVRRDQDALTSLTVANASLQTTNAVARLGLAGGTTNSTSRFELYENGGVPYVQIQNGSAVNYYAIRFGTLEALRINSAGNTGIGAIPLATPPRLLVSGSSTGANPTLLVQHGVANGSSLPVIDARNSAGTSLFLVSGSGDVTVGLGNLVIGTSGKGIDFGATTNSSGSLSSEVLDDYERGTWTPGIATGGGSITLNTTISRGVYVKIGRMVWIGGTVRSSAISTPTGICAITGLPFTSDTWNSGQTVYLSFVGEFFSSTGLTAWAHTGGTVFQSSNEIDMFRYTTSAVYSDQVAANWDASCEFSFTFCYNANV